MAESVVLSMGQTIGKLLIDEAKLLWGVESKVKDLQKELELNQGFMRDADARQERQQAVGVWVAQLRDIAYDAKDVIERYILRVAQKKGQNIIKAYAYFMAKCTCLHVHVVGTEIGETVSFINVSIQAFCFASVINILVAPVQARIRPNDAESRNAVPSDRDTPWILDGLHAVKVHNLILFTTSTQPSIVTAPKSSLSSSSPVSIVN